MDLTDLKSRRQQSADLSGAGGGDSLCGPSQLRESVVFLRRACLPLPLPSSRPLSQLRCLLPFPPSFLLTLSTWIVPDDPQSQCLLIRDLNSSAALFPFGV